MKKRSDVIEVILYYLIGFLIFFMIVSLVEYIFILHLSDSPESLIELVNINYKKCFKIYTFVFICMYVLNLIYGLIIVRVLNKKLKKIR